MDPRVRAIADRFIYEQATLKHILGLAPDGFLERPVAHQGLQDVRTLLQHLALSLHDYAARCMLWLRGDVGFPSGWRADDVSIDLLQRWQRTARTSSDLVSLFGSGLNDLVAALSLVPESRLHEATASGEPLDVLRACANHCQGHAIALVDALPEVRLDPLVLNWLLHLEFPDEASQRWQRALLDDARKLVASQQEEEE